MDWDQVVEAIKQLGDKGAEAFVAYLWYKGAALVQGWVLALTAGTFIAIIVGRICKAVSACADNDRTFRICSLCREHKNMLENPSFYKKHAAMHAEAENG